MPGVRGRGEGEGRKVRGEESERGVRGEERERERTREVNGVWCTGGTRVGNSCLIQGGHIERPLFGVVQRQNGTNVVLWCSSYTDTHRFADFRIVYWY